MYKLQILLSFVINLETSWSIRPNPEDRMNRKPDDQKTKQNNHKAEKQRAFVVTSTRNHQINILFKIIEMFK